MTSSQPPDKPAKHPLETEEDVLQFWQEIDAFQQSIRNNEGGPKFVFYDGPPFATGLPHYGHIVASTLKDVVPRYQTQMGYQVERRWGFDTHGLPIEYEIEKELGIKTRQEVEDYGIGNYNEKCRSIVLRYASEWQKTIDRLGRWVDFDRGYKTMDLSYMESVWWVFKQLFDQGRVYQSVKVMPYSTGCRTPLSNFEAKSNYKTVKDPSITVKFRVITHQSVDDLPVFFLVWTTTPWTLTSNLAICVNPELTYVLIETREQQVGRFKIKEAKRFILSEASLETYFPNEKYQHIRSFTGQELAGWRYEPLFHYVNPVDYPGCHQVLVDNYVLKDNGTGLVHQAPTFGDDDFRVCSQAGIVGRERAPPELINSHGVFQELEVEEEPDLSNLYFKDADQPILNWLKEKELLFKKDWAEHEYPFCWRSDTPLMYKTVHCWFIEVKSLQEKLLAKNQEIHWMPKFIGENRFQEWLSHCVDWCVSRNRYWGTPIPIWLSDDGEEVVCIGSLAELEEKAGLEKGSVTDLHRHHIDQIQIPSSRGKGMLKRCPEVLDCWFESGAMPYAQSHYPFENKESFEQNFPCDFIAEGVDQTRGWFYTLLILSTALFDKPAFKNVIVNGMVLAEDGEKMSKRKKNYPPPDRVLDEYGADALRLYLINSRVVRADSVRFREEDLKIIVKNVHLMIRNMVQYWSETKDLYESVAGQKWKLKPVWQTNLDKEFGVSTDNWLKLDEPLDSWMLGCLEEFLVGLHKAMAQYDLSPILNSIELYIDQLSRWWIKLNKTRLRLEKGGSLRRIQEVQIGLSVLFTSLYYFAIGVAPFAPFLSEIVYQKLKGFAGGSRLKTITSVHFHRIPQEFRYHRDEGMMLSMKHLVPVMNLIRSQRARRGVRRGVAGRGVSRAGASGQKGGLSSVKMPYAKLIIVYPDTRVLEALSRVASVIQGEGNVLSIKFDDQWSHYVDFTLAPDYKKLGRRLGKKIKPFREFLTKFNQQVTEVSKLVAEQQNLQWAPDEEPIPFEDLEVATQPKAEFRDWQIGNEGELTILLDPRVDDDLWLVYYRRQFTRQVQDLRKKLGLSMTDPVIVVYECLPGNQYCQAGRLWPEPKIIKEVENLVGKLVDRQTFENKDQKDQENLKSLGPVELLTLETEKGKKDLVGRTPERIKVELLLICSK